MKKAKRLSRLPVRLPCQVLLLFTCLLVALTAGCGGECKVVSDCASRGNCFTASCIDKSCDYEPVPDCCGNLICDTSIGENQCTCPGDCGACGGDENDYVFLSSFCNQENECVFGLDRAIVNKSSVASGTVNTNFGPSFEMEAVFNQPFNIDSDNLRLKIIFRGLNNNYVKKLMLTKIEVTGENSKRQKVTLGSAGIHRPFWSIGDVVVEDIILSPEQSGKEERISGLTVTAYFSYDYDYGGKVTEKQGSVQYKYSTLSFVYVDPETQPECPPKPEWDDGNPGTEDTCSSSTNYFVRHEPIPNVCGNYYCDASAGENQCNCQKDCGPCSGDVGDYLEQACNSKAECVTKIKQGFSPVPSTIFNEQNLGYFKINTKIIYDTPFNLDESQFSFEFTLRELDTQYASNVKITEIRLLEGSTMVWESLPNTKFGSSPIKLSSSLDYQLGQNQKEMSLSAKVWYEYEYTSTTQGGLQKETKYGNFVISLGNVVFLDPDE